MSKRITSYIDCLTELLLDNVWWIDQLLYPSGDKLLSKTSANDTQLGW